MTWGCNTPICECTTLLIKWLRFRCKLFIELVTFRMCPSTSILALTKFKFLLVSELKVFLYSVTLLIPSFNKFSFYSASMKVLLMDPNDDRNTHICYFNSAVVSYEFSQKV